MHAHPERMTRFLHCRTSGGPCGEGSFQIAGSCNGCSVMTDDAERSTVPLHRIPHSALCKVNHPKSFRRQHRLASASLTSFGMPAIFSSQGLLHVHCHFRPLTCSRTCNLIRRTQGTRHCKQRLCVPVSLREGDPQEVSPHLPLFACM